VDVPGATLPYEMRSSGMMQQGVASPDLRSDIIKIGDLETNRDVAEAMRRTMSAAEWTSLTGLPYQSLTQNPQLVQDKATEQKAKLQPVQDQLDEINAADELAREEDDAERIAKDQKLQSYDASVLEKAMEQHYGPDLTGKVQRAVVESGELDIDNLAKLGVTEDMLTQTVQHYTEAADKMLEPVGSCTSYAENFLSEPEAKLMRQAIVSRDLASVQRLGMAARDRAAAMNFRQVSEYLTRDERMKVRLREVNRQAVIDLPGVGTTSWANAVTMRLVSFK
jgi:hypothetical protein